MRDLAPDITRQRMLIEGFYGVALDRSSVAGFLEDLVAALGMRAYDALVIFSPGAGAGRAENDGFDAFLPLIDSGVAMYVWSRRKFFSVVIYTCTAFDADAAVRFTRSALDANAELEWASF